MTLNGLIDNNAIVTWNGNVAINDSALTSTISSLTRDVGEDVGDYSITSGVFTTPSSNYNAPTLTGSPYLAITPANLTGTVGDQTKSYGANDPDITGISVILTGLINNSAIVTWNGNVAINDSALTSSISSLTRDVGENVGNYNITNGVFAAPSSNYNAPTFTGTPILSIIPANLTATISNYTKTYGDNDPAFTGVTLNGLIDNNAIVTWNGNVAINDSALTSTISSLTRDVGENVGDYSITSGVFTTPSSNYNAPTLTGSPYLAITPANLTATISNYTKTYGNNDPAFTGVTLNGLIDNNAIVTWNGNVAINDSALTSTISSLTRDVGENVGDYSITSGVFTTPSSNYNAPTLTGSPYLAITPANLTATISNYTKTYGDNDPAFTGVTLNGLIDNNAIVTWNGNVAINDSALTSTISSLTRDVGENVGDYSITSGVFTTPSSNYNAPTLTGSPYLAITPANLTATISNYTKTYGDNDPAFTGVTLNGLIDNNAIVTWNGNVAINDSALTSTISSLTRDVGEDVGDYSITSGVFTTPSSNYNAPTLTGSPYLAITPANLTGTVGDQTKSYGANDPDITGISVILTGLINNSAIVTWNGNVAINDSALTSSISSLTRDVGENVGNYNITNGVFAAPSSNYNAPTFTGTPILSIIPANLTATISNYTKTYGDNDPAFTGVTLNGLIDNNAIVTWNGNVAINDSALTSTISSLTRDVGENVGDYSITSGVFTTPSSNYNAPTLTGSPYLAITPANLTATISNYTKTYGDNDPAFTGVTLNGLIDNNAIVTWNGNVAINDSALTSTISSLTRDVGENVGDYSITSGVFTTPSSNYNAPTLTGSPYLAITPANLTATISNYTKTYGDNDPAFTGVTLNGLINNNAIVTWNGNVAINDSALTSTISSLTRDVGEDVGDYSITSGVFTTPSSNYNAPTLTGSPYLAITPANLTATISNYTRPMVTMILPLPE